MVPWPEHGHLNPLFLPSRFIASHNIHVHLLSLGARSQDLKQCLQGARRNFTNKNLHFCDLSVPTSDSESDKDAYLTLRQVIDIVDEDQDKLIEQLGDEFPTVESTFGPNLEEYIKEEREWKLNNNKPLWCLGPFHMLLESSTDIYHRSTRHVCLEFLDKKDVHSVIFLTFGTTTILSQEQVNELALGLEQSGHKFIWVVREADDEMMDTENTVVEKDAKIELSEGFEERVEGRGIVVRNWAPQLEILGHSSTSGFINHCGWNSCMESISMGVPIASWPIHVD
ncbi:hypothetical protein RND71_005859 [Anisodus tanguticus]|uniref:Glycosyltransferase N-terminal domain-containing protein n=1 Tax=Anisodus tanguticus TaxID=243964 RepID=A0AAE1STY5_9SOLA|nr:hypothetical protein RND71_005859 [Anisodus tanguticus]